MSLRKQLTLRRVLALFLLSVVALNIIGLGSFFMMNLRATQTLAFSYEEEDLQQFLDNDLRNISVILASGSGSGASSLKTSGSLTVTLDRILVRASTLPYHPKEFPTSQPMLHNIFSSPEKITRFALQSNAGFGSAMFSIKGIDAVNALYSLAEETNETSEAAGENTVGDEKFAVDDLKADTEYNPNTTSLVTNLTSQVGYIENQTVEPAYQDYAQFLYTNDSHDAMVGAKADDEKKHNILISGFTNVEDTILGILKDNIAAAYSTSSNILTADDVTVVDYTLNHANMTAYLSEHLIQKVRDAVKDYEKSIEVRTAMHIFGIKLFTARAAPSTDFSLSRFRSHVGNVIRFGQARVSAALTDVKKVGGTIKRKVTTFASNLNTAKDKVLNFGKGLINGALAKMGEIKKSIGDTLHSFGQKFSAAVTPMIKGVKGFVSKGFNTITGALKGITSFIPIIILAMVGGLGAVLVVLFLMNRKRAPPEVMPY